MDVDLATDYRVLFTMFSIKVEHEWMKGYKYLSKRVELACLSQGFRSSQHSFGA